MNGLDRHTKMYRLVISQCLYPQKKLVRHYLNVTHRSIFQPPTYCHSSTIHEHKYGTNLFFCIMKSLLYVFIIVTNVYCKYNCLLKYKNSKNQGKAQLFCVTL